MNLRNIIIVLLLLATFVGGFALAASMPNLLLTVLVSVGYLAVWTWVALAQLTSMLRKPEGLRLMQQEHLRPRPRPEDLADWRDEN